MKKLTFAFLLLLFYLAQVEAGSCKALPQESKLPNFEAVNKEDRILILAPHPDDESLGCAGLIQQAIGARAKVRIAYLTNGEHNQLAFIVYEKRLTFRKGEFIHMGEVRRKEAIKAMKLLGLSETDLVFLGYPDFATLNMFKWYWQSKKPYKDMMTRISSVPYKENFSYGTPYFPEDILSDLKKVILEYKPTKIFVTHPVDVNQDHKAFYLFLQIALSDLSKEINRPKVYFYLIHRVGWPLPRHYHPDISLEPPGQFQNGEFNWMKLGLTKDQLDKKYQAILCYNSQTRSSAFYLLAFARKNELFGYFPDIEVIPQLSLKEKATQFFGFSNMYTDPNAGVLEDLENLVGDKENVSYAVVDDHLLIRIEKAENLKKKLAFQIYLFGYSEKIPFAAMPKICIVTKSDKLKIFDGRRLIKPEGARVTLESDILILRIPLSAIGDPDYILLYIRAYKGSLPADATGFRKIIIVRKVNGNLAVTPARK